MKGKTVNLNKLRYPLFLDRISPTSSSYLDAIPVRMPMMRSFMKLDKLILKFMKEKKKWKNSPGNNKNSHVRGLKDINMPYKVCIFKIVCDTDI